MQKPFKYSIWCNKSNELLSETNIAPLLHHLQTYEPINEEGNIRQLKQTKTVLVDTRYKAKLRLYNHITYTNKGLTIPIYKPFDTNGTGKTKPILNF